MNGKNSPFLSQLASLLHLLLLGLMAGFFYAYSVDVMPALDQLEPAVAIVAMQAINETVRNPVFFATFFLTPFVGLLAAVLQKRGGRNKAAGFGFGAVAVYAGLAFLPTITINVPMNEALAKLPITPDAKIMGEAWQTYSSNWTFWNTMRIVTTCLALLLAGISIAEWGRCSGTSDSISSKRG